jgi:hypothetical protein
MREESTHTDMRTTCLLAVGKFPNTVSGLVQWALHTIEVWCDELGLLVNPDKTRLVAFMRRKLPGFFEPCIFGKTLHCSMSVKYLGVILDSRLAWKEHVDVKVRKAQNLLWACRRAYGVTWGLGPRVIHWLYVSIIRPSAWEFAAGTYLLKLHCLQNKVLRTIGKYPRC